MKNASLSIIMSRALCLMLSLLTISISASHEKSFEHSIKLQLADSQGRPVNNAQFWVTLDIVVHGSEVTILFPSINFQTVANNPAIAPGGFLYSVDCFLPKEIRPQTGVTTVAASNNGMSPEFAFTQPPPTLPVPPLGYLVQVSKQGEIFIKCEGTAGNIIPAGPQILLPCSVQYTIS